MIARKIVPLAVALILTTSGAALLPATAQADSPPIMVPSPPPALAGGWSELRPNDPELIAAGRFVVPRLGRPRARLLRIEGGERQLVAGMNYRIALQLRDRSRWRAQVWRKLDGSLQLTRFARVK